jgi:two-component system CheB/CheR fusion protein
MGCFITVQYHNEKTEHKQITPAAPFLKQPTRGLSKDRTRDFPIVYRSFCRRTRTMELFLKNMPQYSGMASLLFNISILLMLEFYRNYCNAILLWRYYRSLIDLRILPDHIYVIPPNKSLTILNGVLHLFALFKVGGCDYRSIYSFVP